MIHSLNAAQSEAVRTLSGPLLVLAGAGTGKTRVVTMRIAELIRHGARPGRILGVTFTNKAAGEMRQRIRELLRTGKNEERPEISTFHSYCVRILRRHAKFLGYPRLFTIYDRADQLSIVRGVLREIRVTGNLLRPEDVIARIGSWKSAALRPPEASAQATTDREHLAAVAFRRYQQSLRAAGAVDFDDLLLLTDELFSKNREARREEARRFDHILIDEYQDTSHSQYRIVKNLAVGHRNLCVVGDDDQSIYGWRGAEVKHILRFKKDWPDAKVVRLEENYRSTMAILEVADRLIQFNKRRFGKHLRSSRTGGERPQVLMFRDEAREAEATVADIRRHLRNPSLEPRDFAILFRTNEQPRVFEAELRRVELPYVLIGGRSFFDRKEVRDIVAYLKVLVSPCDDVSLLRIINTPARGIGRKAATDINQCAIQQGQTVWDLLERPGSMSGFSSVARESLLEFRDLIHQLRAQLTNQTVASIIQELIDVTNYRKEVERLYQEPHERQSRWAAVEEVVNAAATHDKRERQQASLCSFLDELTVAANDRETDKETSQKRNALALMTLHSAKGLEFPHVYIVGMEEGFLPHRRSLSDGDDQVDEERRLCYVGITRAQERLTFSLAQTRMKWGKARPTKPSRFLYELSGQSDVSQCVDDPP